MNFSKRRKYKMKIRNGITRVFEISRRRQARANLIQWWRDEGRVITPERALDLDRRANKDAPSVAEAIEFQDLVKAHPFIKRPATVAELIMAEDLTRLHPTLL
jgi:hypothetical protein